MSLEAGRRLPICFGSYRRGERECDGGGSEPCLFRDRCLALKMVCEDGDRAPADFVYDGKVTSSETGELVRDALFKYEIRNGVAHRRFHRSKIVYRDKPPSELFARRREALDRLVVWYFRRIAKIGGVELVKKRHLATDRRTLYIDDYEPTEGYTTLGFKIVGQTYRKVTRIWKRKYRPKRLVVDVALTKVQLEKGLPDRIWKRLRFANPKKESAFPARIANLDYAIAEPLAKLLGEYIQQGFFDTARRPKVP